MMKAGYLPERGVSGLLMGGEMMRGARAVCFRILGRLPDLFRGAIGIFLALVILTPSGWAMSGSERDLVPIPQAAGTVEAETSPAESDGESNETSLEKKWGIQIHGIRLAAAGYMLDFRYRILDPDKAAPLVRPKEKAYLIDQASGATFLVPTPPKTGQLRQTVRSGKPKADRTYFVFFANPGGYVKAGNKVTVVIGDFKAKDLVVE